MSGKKFAPSDTDVRIGQMIRVMCEKMGLSQKDVANKIGITFQQVQKYETAANRISVSRLCQIAHAIGVPVVRFFNELDNDYITDKKTADIIIKLNSLSNSNRKNIIWMIDNITKKIKWG